MAVIVIRPIEFKTVDGYDAVINGIDPLAHDCLSGRVIAGQGPIDVDWDKGGFCRNSPPGFNLPPGNSDIEDVIKTVELLEPDE